MESSTPEFWDQRYRAARLPWDARGVPPELHEYLARSPARGRALIPGCGSGYEVRALHEAGWETTAIDFAPGAIARARALLGDLGACVREADFFNADLRVGYDLIYERTFLCSLPPACWPDYARRMGELLKPGAVLAGIFFYGDEPEPPPHPLTRTTAERLLAADFALVEDRAIPAAQSLPLYATGERWQVWRRHAFAPANQRA